MGLGKGRWENNSGMTWRQLKKTERAAEKQFGLSWRGVSIRTVSNASFKGCLASVFTSAALQRWPSLIHTPQIALLSCYSRCVYSYEKDLLCSTAPVASFQYSERDKWSSLWGWPAILTLRRVRRERKWWKGDLQEALQSWTEGGGWIGKCTMNDV